MPYFPPRIHPSVVLYYDGSGLDYFMQKLLLNLSFYTHRYSIIQITIQAHRYTTIQIHKYTTIQIHRYSTVHYRLVDTVHYTTDSQIHYKTGLQIHYNTELQIQYITIQTHRYTTGSQIQYSTIQNYRYTTIQADTSVKWIVYELSFSYPS